MCIGSTFLKVINVLKHFVTQNSIAILGRKKYLILGVQYQENQFVVLNGLIMINIKKSISYLVT